MISTSWGSNIEEVDEEVQVSWGRVREWWTARRRMECSVRQSKLLWCELLHNSVVLKRELSRKAVLIFVLILSYGYES